MRIMIVHLSDIHLRGEDNPVLTRAGAVVRAVRGIDPTVDDYVVVVTGDIAYSGKELQYRQALDFIVDIEDLLGAEKDVRSVHMAIVPGNHDCDFDLGGSARDTLVNSFRTETDLSKIDDSVVTLCTGVQHDFFDFYELLHNTRLSNPLCYVHRFNIADKWIAVRCINTAWMSRKKEEQGALWFPLNFAQTEDSETAECDLVISALHHTYSWLGSVNGRNLREYLESTSDVILTGHEHDPVEFAVLHDDASSSQYIEGGVLQEHSNPSSSSFNALVVDLGLEQQKVVSFVWDDGRFTPRDPDVRWRSLVRNTRRLGSLFEYTDEFADELEDPGAPYKHPRKHDLRLSDIYVAPSFREMSQNEIGETKTVTLTQLLERTGGMSLIAISGAEKIGKTALARVICRRMRDRGIIPILTSGHAFRKSDESRILHRIRCLFEHQYQGADYTHFSQLEIQQKAIIIDDYMASKLNAKGRSRQLEILSRIFGTVIVIGDDFMQLEDMLTYEDSKGALARFSSLQITPFGSYRMYQLIEKWVSLGQEYELSEVEFDQQCRAIFTTLSQVIGRNVVPAYPLFILTMIQALENQTGIAFEQGSCGLLYQVLIATALAIPHATVRPDAKETFLSCLAFHMHNKRTSRVSEAELRSVFDNYCNTYMQLSSFTTAIGELLKSSLLCQNEADGLYGFKYKYIYYYFTAKYISDNIRDSEVELLVRIIVEKLYIDENANIALFLSYLVKDAVLVDEILRLADSLYSDTSAFDFDGDVCFLDTLGIRTPRLILANTDPKENRKELLSARDEYEERTTREENEPDDDIDEQIEGIFQINTAFRCIQVLGQLARSSPGALLKTRKIEIVRTCSALGMRALKMVFKHLEDGTDDCLEYLVSDVFGDMGETALKRAQSLLYFVCLEFMFVMIKAISYAIGSRSLEDIYAAVREQNACRSYDILDFNIRLDHFQRFPSREFEHLLKTIRPGTYTHNLVRLLVFDYLHLNTVEISIKQSICDKAGISMRGLRVAEFRTAKSRALSPPNQGSVGKMDA